MRLSPVLQELISHQINYDGKSSCSLDQC